MPTAQRMTYCPSCEKKTLHIQEVPNYLLHVVLSVMSAGAWLIVWLLFVNRGEAQCTVCGGPDSFSDVLAKPGKVLDNMREMQRIREENEARRKAKKAARAEKRARG